MTRRNYSSFHFGAVGCLKCFINQYDIVEFGAVIELTDVVKLGAVIELSDVVKLGLWSRTRSKRSIDVMFFDINKDGIIYLWETFQDNEAWRGLPETKVRRALVESCSRKGLSRSSSQKELPESYEGATNEANLSSWKSDFLYGGLLEYRINIQESTDYQSLLSLQRFVIVVMFWWQLVIAIMLADNVRMEASGYTTEFLQNDRSSD
ncbi:hypothetical protein ACH5RR_029894 [Cinchona calisaya]|uniref:Uncharacterized protein n=1 Tax=Cinchona calisaya TaxID=153742 RepID=A0ABD2YT44_9GENT